MIFRCHPKKSERSFGLRPQDDREQAIDDMFYFRIGEQNNDRRRKAGKDRWCG